MEKRLFKSRKEKMIAGVAGGLAEYFDIDPVLVRLAFVVLTVTHGVGVLAYIILWIVVPQRKLEAAFSVPGAEGAGGQTVETALPATNPAAGSRAKRNSGLIGGSILIGIGLLFLLDNLIPGLDFDQIWPLLLIALGGGLLWNSIKRDSISGGDHEIR